MFCRKKKASVAGLPSTVHTAATLGEPIQLLCVQERCGSPDADCAVVGSAGHETGNTWVPADAVHCARVSRQLHDRQLAALVPNIYLMI